MFVGVPEGLSVDDAQHHHAVYSVGVNNVLEESLKEVLQDLGVSDSLLCQAHQELHREFGTHLFGLFVLAYYYGSQLVHELWVDVAELAAGLGQQL